MQFPYFLIGGAAETRALLEQERLPSRGRSPWVLCLVGEPYATT